MKYKAAWKQIQHDKRRKEHEDLLDSQLKDTQFAHFELAPLKYDTLSGDSYEVWLYMPLGPKGELHRCKVAEVDEQQVGYLQKYGFLTRAVENYFRTFMRILLLEGW